MLLKKKKIIRIKSQNKKLMFITIKKKISPERNIAVKRDIITALIPLIVFIFIYLSMPVSAVIRFTVL